MVTVTAYRGDKQVYKKNFVDTTIEKIFKKLEDLLFHVSKKETEYQRKQLEHLHESKKPKEPVPKDDLNPAEELCQTK